MVEIAPFKGVMFSEAERRSHGGRLVAPPYDVLNLEEQRKCLELHPHNILHLDYNLSRPEDPGQFSWHERSGVMLREWLKAGILERSAEPAVFHVETTCPNPVKGGLIVRHGFVCLMRLELLEGETGVRRHEKTFSSHKEERLSLMKATHAHLSQVFGFFPDEDRRVMNLMREVAGRGRPEMDFADYRGFRHRVWLDREPQTINQLVSALKERKVYLADGHHRYETALNYRDHLRETGVFSPGSDYVMIYLCPMSDPGLVVLPTHRLLNGEATQPDEFLNRLSAYFKISGKAFTDNNEAQMRERFLTKLKKQRGHLGLYLAGRQTYYVLKMREAVEAELAGQGEPPELAALDTVILSGIVFKKILGLTETNLDDPAIVTYVSNLNLTLEMIRQKEKRAAFILNPSTVEDVIRVSEKGLTMPRKSTFFYPKVTTGLMFNLID